MNFEVLVVDDNHQAATEFARLINVQGQLNAVATDDPEEAVRLIQTNPIKVALLDQRMPKCNGTELYERLVEKDSLLKAIMLTGEADAQEVGSALKLGFVDYIHKSEVSDITTRVLLHYCSYHNDLAEQYSNCGEPIYSYNNGFLGKWGPKIDFYLVTSEVVSREHVLEDSWKTIANINAGETIKTTLTKLNVERVIIEEEEKAKLDLNLSIKAPIFESLTGKIKSAVEERVKKSSQNEMSMTDTVEKEYKLPAEPEQQNVLHIKSRKYEHAPVYEQLKIAIRKECSSCSVKEIIFLNINTLTPKVATRQIDYMSDSSRQISDTGILHT